MMIYECWLGLIVKTVHLKRKKAVIYLLKTDGASIYQIFLAKNGKWHMV